MIRPESLPDSGGLLYLHKKKAGMAAGIHHELLRKFCFLKPWSSAVKEDGQEGGGDPADGPGTPDARGAKRCL